MRSIQTKIIVFIMMVIMLCTGIIGGIGMIHLKTVSEQNSAQIMNLSCREEGNRLDHIFHSIEQSVKIISQNTIQSMEMEEVLKSDSLRELLINDLRPIVLAAAGSTQGAVAVYVHFNPEIAPADSGVFYSKTTTNPHFHEQPVTDLSEVEEDDLSSMDWYYKPIEKGKEVWLEPYDNGKIDEPVISYVVPIYQNNVLLGVAGMDVLFSDIEKRVSGITSYKEGMAYLINAENEIVYHPEEETQFPIDNLEAWDEFHIKAKRQGKGEEIFEYKEDGKEYKVACYEMENEMSLLLVVPTDVIDAENNKLIGDMLVSVVVIIVISILLSVLISQGIIRPLKELTKASKEIADGNLRITIPSGTHDEVGELAISLQQTVDCLRVYMDRISDLAYTDALTSVKSKTAYNEEVRRINHNVQNGFHQFGVIVFDLNGLKEINDTFGHDVGDMYIKNACKLICTTYKHSPVYRVGGDEFAAVLSGQDLLNSESLIYRFYERMQESNSKAKRVEDEISVAAGMAIFNEESDTGFQSVYKRADEKMYRNKASMKSGNGPIFEIEKFKV
ncbi:MAG: diguanylate cyclase [Lachnospiraceae bacterium]|nr:diguanylate cyclase [Lachnospiraceae bacterium]